MGNYKPPCAGDIGEALNSGLASYYVSVLPASSWRQIRSLDARTEGELEFTTGDVNTFDVAATTEMFEFRHQTCIVLVFEPS